MISEITDLNEVGPAFRTPPPLCGVYTWVPAALTHYTSISVFIFFFFWYNLHVRFSLIALVLCSTKEGLFWSPSLNLSLPDLPHNDTKVLDFGKHAKNEMISHYLRQTMAPTDHVTFHANPDYLLPHTPCRENTWEGLDTIRRFTYQNRSK